MYSSNKNKIINKLRKGYTPIELSPKQDLSSTFKNIFKPLIKRKDLDFFFELYNMNDVTLKAWSFLGIYNIIETQTEIGDDNKSKLHSIVLDLLHENREITYYGGSVETRVPLREHHVTRLAELNTSLIFDPVLEYCKSFQGNPDNVIMELLEHVLSHSSVKEVEDLIFNFLKLIDPYDSRKQISMIRSFENLNRNITLQRKGEITLLFKGYLTNSKDQDNDDIGVSSKKRELRELVFEVGAKLGLELEEETLKFVDSLKYPYNSLDIIAEKYKDDERFQSILLKKLNESQNPHFVVEILKAILVIKDKISNWENLVTDNIIKYQLIDGDLIKGMKKSNLIDESMMISFLNEASDWSLMFLREFLIQYPETLDKWEILKKSLIKRLQSYKSEMEDLKQFNNEDKVIEFIFSLIIDLELKVFLKYSLETFKRLENEKLKKMALFPVLKFGEESLLLDLKEYMKENPEVGKFIMQFINSLERNDWRFYY